MRVNWENENGVLMQKVLETNVFGPLLISEEKHLNLHCMKVVQILVCTYVFQEKIITDVYYIFLQIVNLATALA